MVLYMCFVLAAMLSIIRNRKYLKLSKKNQIRCILSLFIKLKYLCNSILLCFVYFEIMELHRCFVPLHPSNSTTPYSKKSIVVLMYLGR